MATLKEIIVNEMLCDKSLAKLILSEKYKNSVYMQDFENRKIFVSYFYAKTWCTHGISQRVDLADNYKTARVTSEEIIKEYESHKPIKLFDVIMESISFSGNDSCIYFTDNDVIWKRDIKTLYITRVRSTHGIIKNNEYVLWANNELMEIK